MADIFTRSALKGIMEDGSLTPGQRVEQVYGLFGRAVEDGYVEKDAAARAQAEAVERAQGREAPDVTQSEAYLALKGEFDAYRAMQQARTSADFAGVKPKFFETVYGMVDRAEGARPVAEQLADIRRDFEEYFVDPSGPVGHLPNPSDRYAASSPWKGSRNPSGNAGQNPSDRYAASSPWKGSRNPSGPAGHLPLEGEARWEARWEASPSGWEAAPGGRSPAVVLPRGQPPAPGSRMTLSEAMRRANAGEKVDIGRIG